MLKLLGIKRLLAFFSVCFVSFCKFVYLPVCGKKVNDVIMIMVVGDFFFFTLVFRF